MFNSQRFDRCQRRGRWRKKMAAMVGERKEDGGRRQRLERGR
jgi:hypothetical protein